MKIDELNHQIFVFDGECAAAVAASVMSGVSQRKAISGFPDGRLIDAKNQNIHLQWFHDALGNLRTEHHPYPTIRTAKRIRQVKSRARLSGSAATT